MSERRELLTPIVTCTKKINLNSTTKSFNLKKVIILPLLELFRDVTSTFDCLKHRNLTERAKCFENCEQNQHYRLESYRWSKTITKLYVNIQINYLYKSFFIGFNITLVKYFWMKSLNNFLPFFLSLTYPAIKLRQEKRCLVCFTWQSRLGRKIRSCWNNSSQIINCRGRQYAFKYGQTVRWTCHTNHQQQRSHSSGKSIYTLVKLCRDLA